MVAAWAAALTSTASVPAPNRSMQTYGVGVMEDWVKSMISSRSWVTLISAVLVVRDSSLPPDGFVSGALGAVVPVIPDLVAPLGSLGEGFIWRGLDVGGPLLCGGRYGSSCAAW